VAQASGLPEALRSTGAKAPDYVTSIEAYYVILKKPQVPDDTSNSSKGLLILHCTCFGLWRESRPHATRSGRHLTKIRGSQQLCLHNISLSLMSTVLHLSLNNAFMMANTPYPAQTKHKTSNSFLSFHLWAQRDQTGYLLLWLWPPWEPKSFGHCFGLSHQTSQYPTLTHSLTVFKDNCPNSWNTPLALTEDDIA
jgi:hypothetical protein